MNTTTEPLVVNGMPSSLRFHLCIPMAFTLIFSVTCFTGWMFWSTTRDDIAFTQFAAWFFLAATLIQLWVLLTYNVYFLIDGRHQRVIRVRRLMWWKWIREFPAAHYTAVQIYQSDDPDQDGYHLQLTGEHDRLRLAYSPSGKGLTELAEKIADAMKLPCHRLPATAEPRIPA